MDSMLAEYVNINTDSESDHEEGSGKPSIRTATGSQDLTSSDAAINKGKGTDSGAENFSGLANAPSSAPGSAIHDKVKSLLTPVGRTSTSFFNSPLARSVIMASPSFSSQQATPTQECKVSLYFIL